MEGGERNEGGTEGRRDRGLWKRVAPIHLHRYRQDVDMLHLYRTLEGGREGGRGEGGRGREGGREGGRERGEGECEYAGREGGRGKGGRGRERREGGRNGWTEAGRERL